MNNLSIKQILLIISIIMVVLFIVLYNPSQTSKDNISNMDSFIKNVSEDSTYSKKWTYKKWDLLDYISFINFWTDKSFSIDINKISSILDVEKVFINDNEVNKNELQNLNLKWMTIIKIRWKAKQNNLDWKINQENLIDTKIINKEENVQNDNKKQDEIVVKTKNPKNLILNSTRFSSNINNLLQIKWDNLDTIDYVNIWWFSIKPQMDSWALLVSLDKNIFASWEYFLFFQLKNWEIFTTENKITFFHNQQKINIANLTPDVIKNDQDRFIVIQWNWFKKIVSVQLNNNIILKDTSFNVVNDNVAAIKIPKWLNPWTYYFNIMDTEKIYELKNNTFTITN